MKPLLLLFLLFFSSGVFAQKLVGEVRDAQTSQPVSGVQVISKYATKATDSRGQFEMPGVKVGDYISFRLLGFETREIKVRVDDFKTPVSIYIKAVAINLETVNIRQPRNYQKDSLGLRKDFESVFNYKAAGIKDMFVRVNAEAKVPLALVKPPSTSSIATVNVLQVIKLFSKKKVQTSKLKTTLLADESANYVAQRFSKNKISASIGLTGDSLNVFMERYKPTLAEVKRMNDYQLSVYIKNAYKEFIKP